MNVLYTVFAVIGTVLIIALAVLIFVFRIKITLRLKLKPGKTIPVEDFLPRTAYGMAFFIADLGYIGLLLCSLGFPWWLTLLLGIPFALLINFIGAHFILPFIKDLYYGKLPDPDELTGIEAVCMENIRGDDYGRIKFKYNDRTFVRDCIPANHTPLAKGEKVIIITGEENLLFVEKPSEIYDALNEEEDENAV